MDKQADYVDQGFAQFTIGSHCLMLSQNHLIPLEDFQSGIILHIEVVGCRPEPQTVERAWYPSFKRSSCNRLGTESLLVEGPAGLVIDFYRMK